MIKTVSQAIDDMAVSLGASPSAEIPTVAQALENVYTALGGTRTDLDTLVVSEVIDLVAPLIQGGGGGGGDLSIAKLHVKNNTSLSMQFYVICASFDELQQSFYISSIDPEKDVDVVLYKGYTFMEPADAYDVTYETTGSVTYEDGQFDIVGDGSVTINEA